MREVLLGVLNQSFIDVMMIDHFYLDQFVFFMLWIRILSFLLPLLYLTARFGMPSFHLKLPGLPNSSHILLYMVIKILLARCYQSILIICTLFFGL